MNPVGVVLLPLSVLVLAGTTVSPGSAAAPGSTRREQVVLRSAPDLPSPGAVDRPVTVGDGGEDDGGDDGLGQGERGGLGGRWSWPLQPRPTVVRPFLRPATRYGAGHRGADLAGAAEQEVHAVEAGTVTHVGSIAARGTVTVLHPSGIRSTYEPVKPTVVTGAAVARGAVLGRLEGNGSHCGPAACLHLGAVRGDVYLDPLAFLRGGQRVRLLPLGLVPLGQAPLRQAPEG